MADNPPSDHFPAESPPPLAVQHDEEEEEEEEPLNITIHFHGNPLVFSFPPTATILDLSTTIASDLSIPAPNQKFLIAPKPGLLRPPFKDPSLRLSTLPPKAKITLLGSTPQEIADLDATLASVRARQESRRAALAAGRKVHATKSRSAHDASTYTFGTLRALAHLPRADKSLRFLERLRDDPGVKAAMRKHKFSVGLLTEMDPAAHTTHESRTLGLNRNRGEVIELRLRTDAYDGYRDYRTIRRTLAHELAHNVVGPHNKEFHALWNEIEREIERNDYMRGGHRIGAEEFYNPDDEGLDDELADEGGWEGGSYVLGGTSSSAASAAQEPLSRREAMARAAEERVKKQQQQQQQQHGASRAAQGDAAPDAPGS